MTAFASNSISILINSKSTDVVDEGTYVVRTTPTFEPTRESDYTVTVTAAPGRTPPFGSVMVPRMRASVCCAAAVPPSSASTAKANARNFLSTVSPSFVRNTREAG